MGQKTHPYAFRLGVVTDWKSRWYSDKDYVEQVNEDWRIRDYLTGELKRGAVSRIDIERTRDRVVVELYTARPGVVIGRKGAEAERLRAGLEQLAGRPVKLNIIEVKDPEADAQLLAQGIADQLEGRVAFRRAMKRAVASALKAGAEGVRVECNGRLGGSDMGRREWYREGRVPLHTIRADIEFGTATARTTVGAVGVKVWVYRGDVVNSAKATREKITAEAALATGGPARQGRTTPAKARAEHAVGAGKMPRLIEAGGGKRLIEAGGGKREGRRVIEAGGGRRLTPEDAELAFLEAREEIAEPAVAAEAPGEAPVIEAAANAVIEAAPAPVIEAAPDAVIEEASEPVSESPTAGPAPDGEPPAEEPTGRVEPQVESPVETQDDKDEDNDTDDQQDEV